LDQPHALIGRSGAESRLTNWRTLKQSFQTVEGPDRLGSPGPPPQSGKQVPHAQWLIGLSELSGHLPNFAATWQNQDLSFRIMEEDSMDRLETMSTFVAVVEAGSLSAAARLLKTPLTTVSRKVSELESHLRTRLFNRSSRQLVLTDAGSSYLAACKRILADVTEAERTASGEYTAPTGELSVTTPLGLGRTIVIPIMADFLRAYPDIKIRMIPTDRVLSLFQEQIDVGVRIGALPDSSLIAIPLGATRRVLCASPAYLAARGTPRTPEELTGHDCINYAGFASSDVWAFVRDKATIAVPVHTRLAVGSVEAACAAARAGIGITIAFAYQLLAAPEGGALTTVLDDFQPAPQPVNLVYAANRFLPIKVRAFLDFATPRLKRVFADSKLPNR
jgi:DNA-binding transcriptional LysR family regulator